MANEEGPKRAGSPVQPTLGRRRFFELSAGAAALAALGPSAIGCGGGPANPGDGNPPVEPIVFVHLSDSHFGGETKLGEVQDPAALKVDPKALLTALIGQVVPAVEPLATIHTGDLVNEGFELAPWQSYSAVFADAGGTLSYPKNYVEILGNHDVKRNTDPDKGTVADGLTNFTQYSMTGRVLGPSADKHGITVLDAGGQGVSLIRTNTSESPTDDNQENIAGYFTEAQQLALLADPSFDANRFLNVVLGHHPIEGDPSVPGDVPIHVGNDFMLKLVAAAKAPIYLCGHIHFPVVLWVKHPDGTHTLMVQASTFGRRGQLTSFFLIAYDQGQPTAKRIYIDATQKPSVAWPLVFITAPANADLGGVNPHAISHAPGSSPILRAMVFPPKGDGSGTVRVKWARTMVDGGAEGPLTQRTDRLWDGPISLAGLAPGKHTVTVMAAVDVVDGADHHLIVGSDAIEIVVGG